jgi:serine protease AprX
VIVMAAPGTEQAVRQRAAELGLRIIRQLTVVNGFTAQGPADAAQQLAGTPGVISVTQDRPVTPLSIVPSLGYDPADTGSSSAVSRIVGAQQAWAAGYTGTGIDVAVIDTGVAPVAGLNTPGKVLTGPDLSLDAAVGAAAGLDAYGHGTFMAGLIAGRDATATASATGCTTCLNPSGYSDTTTFVGMAPGARIVNVKVGAADGATDVSQVIAAIDWVTQHAHDPGLNIKVLSLSYGTTSTQAYTVDPLAQAAEQAWKRGIVVVTAAGNEGRSEPTLADPAYDPFVLAVGGQETKGTLTTSDDKVPSFSEHGTAARPVDVVAPATHVLGLRVPGSYIDTLTTNIGQVGTRFQRGSGTSQATAIVSGVVALLAQKYPDATPDQLKALVTGTATLLPKTGTTELDTKTLLYSGHGSVNAAKALATPLPAARQTAAPSSGLGTLDAARGGVYLADGGVELTGQRDVFGHPFSSAGMAQAQTTATSWSGGIWNGSRWSGDGWSSTGWSAATTSGSGWSGTNWAGNDWAGNDWAGSRWSGMTWDGSRWSGSGWSGSRWSGSRWSGGDWSGSRWSGAGWS